MGQFDLKKATIVFFDGRKATLTSTQATSINNRFTLTDVSTHRGTQAAVTMTIVNAGISHATLDVAVSGKDITITPITDGSSIITSTAAAVRTAINANSSAAALVLASLPGTGAGVVLAQAKTSLGTGPRTLTLKVADGMISYDEKKARKYTKDRGKLNGIMNADEEPMDVKLNTIWEFMTASTGDTATPEDVLKNRGEASGWVSTDEDPCNPFCVDIEVHYAPNCNSVDDEFIVLPYYRYETLNHNFKEGVLDTSGKCNVVQATLVRE